MNKQSVISAIVLAILSLGLGFVVHAMLLHPEYLKLPNLMRNEADGEMLSTKELSLELAARMLLLSDSVANVADARKAVEEKLADGSALERFRTNVELQGGDPKVCDDPKSLLTPNLVECRIESKITGIVSDIDTFKIGSSMVDIGGGRINAEHSVDPAVGYRCEVIIGAAIKQGQPLGIAHCRDNDQADKVREKLRSPSG